MALIGRGTDSLDDHLTSLRLVVHAAFPIRQRRHSCHIEHLACANNTTSCGASVVLNGGPIVIQEKFQGTERSGKGRKATACEVDQTDIPESGVRL